MNNNNLIKIVEDIHPNVEKTEFARVLVNVVSNREIKESEIADLIEYFCENSDKDWHLKEILGTISEVIDLVNWREVFKSILKEKKENIVNVNYTRMLVNCWVSVSGSITVPYELFFKCAGYLEERLFVEFYKMMIENKPGNISFYSNIFFKKLVSRDEFRQKYKRSIEFESNLNCIEIFEAIKDNLELIEFVKSISSEYCILGLAEILKQNNKNVIERNININNNKEEKNLNGNNNNKEEKFLNGNNNNKEEKNLNGNNNLSEELILLENSNVKKVFLDLLKHFTEGSTNHFVFFILLNRTNEQIIYSFEEIGLSLTRVLDILLEHKSLKIITETLKPYKFCVDIIILASRRDHLNLDLWIDNLKDYDSFIVYLHDKVVLGTEGIFPLTKQVINTLLRAIEGKINLNSDICSSLSNNPIVNQTKLLLVSKNKSSIKSKIATNIKLIKEIKTAISDTSTVKDKTTSFLAEIIQSECGVNELLNRLMEFKNRDELGGCKTIYNVFLDNYKALWKLPNSETVAKLYGEVIKRKLGFKQFHKQSLNQIKKSLISPSSDREYAFALRTLEEFYNQCPDEFTELEGIEDIKMSLIKRELIIINDDGNENNKNGTSASGSICSNNYSSGRTEISLENLIYYSTLSSQVDPILYKKLGQFIFNEFWFSCSEGQIEIEKSIVNLLNYSKNDFCVVILKNLILNFDKIVIIVEYLPQLYFDTLIEHSFMVLNNFLNFKISNETIFVSTFGKFLGRVLLGKNRPISLNLFDLESFTQKFVEYRRITFMINFFTNFILEGEASDIYIPNNPWIMRFLNLLEELYSCTLYQTRVLIKKVFLKFHVPLNPNKHNRIISTLAKYDLKALFNNKNVNYDKDLKQNEGIVKMSKDDKTSNNLDNKNDSFNNILDKDKELIKKVIYTSIDFSIREAANIMVNNVHRVVKSLTINLFSKFYIKNEIHKKFYLKHFIVNLTQGLVFSNSQEILKKSIYDNLTHFIKISGIQLEETIIYQIIEDNLSKTIEIVKASVVTSILEEFDIFNNIIIKNIHKDNSVKNIPKSVENGGTDKTNGTDKPSENDKTNENDVDIKTDKTNENDVDIKIDDGWGIQPEYLNNLRILNDSAFMRKISLRKVENNEYQEIRSYLIQLGRKIPIRKKDFISEEFPMIISENKYKNFKKMISYIENRSLNKDEDCTNLAKYLVGHAIQNKCKDSFIFEFLNVVFEISPRTKKETVGWLIYSDEEKTNLNLVKNFIERNFIFIEEYDTALSKLIQNGNDTSIIQFAINLINEVVFGDVVLCSLYAFLRTIKSISIYNNINSMTASMTTSSNKALDDFKTSTNINNISSSKSKSMRTSKINGVDIKNFTNNEIDVSSFLKKVEEIVIDFGVNNSKISSAAVFDSFIENSELKIDYSEIHAYFRQNYNLSDFNFLDSLKSSWYHFVFFTGEYRFFKLDILSYIIKHDACAYIYLSLEILTWCIEKKLFDFSIFFCRFFIGFLDSINIPDLSPQLVTHYRSFNLKVLELLNPINVPSFATQYLEIIKHSYFENNTDQENLFIAINCLDILNYNSKYEKNIYEYFNGKNLSFFIKKYNTYLSFLTPNYCINLKNLFNYGQRTPTFNSYNCYFTKNGLHHNFMDAIDFCNTNSEQLKYFILKQPKETILLILLRYHGLNPPEGIKKAYEEACKTESTYIKEIEKKYGFTVNK